VKQTPFKGISILLMFISLLGCSAVGGTFTGNTLAGNELGGNALDEPQDVGSDEPADPIDIGVQNTGPGSITENFSDTQYRPLTGGAPDPELALDEEIKKYVAVSFETIDCSPHGGDKFNVKMTGQLEVNPDLTPAKQAELKAAVANRWLRIHDWQEQQFKEILTDSDGGFSFKIVAGSELPFSYYLMPRIYEPANDQQGQLMPCPGSSGSDCSGNGRQLPTLLVSNSCPNPTDP